MSALGTNKCKSECPKRGRGADYQAKVNQARNLISRQSFKYGRTSGLAEFASFAWPCQCLR